MPTPLSIILPSTTPMDITIATISYKAILNSVRIRSNLPQIDVTTYAGEANGEFIGGIERLSIDFGGILKKGLTVASGPMIPLPQGVAVIVTWDTGATFTFTMNFSEGEISRPAGQIGTITGSGFSTGTFGVVWIDA